MSDGYVQPCRSWSAFKIMSFMTCPFCLAVCRRYSRLCRQTQATSLGQILIVLNRRDATAVSGIHPFEITGVFKRPPDNLAKPIHYDFERQVLRASFVAGENAP